MARRSWAWLLLLGVSACPAYAVQGGLVLLRMTPGARMAAMAGAGVAAAGDAASLLANPGALGALRGSQVYLGHNEWLQGIDHDLLATTLVTRKQAWAVSMGHLAVGDIELRTMPTAEPLAVVSAHEVVIALSYARCWHGRLYLGVTGKYLYDKIHLDTAGGVALDVGGLYQTGWSGVTCAVAVRNLGSTGRLREARLALPYQVQAGVAWTVSIAPWQSQLAMLSDLLLERGERARLLLGTEGVLHGMVALRLGYAFGYDSRGLSAGLGLRSGRYSVDYSYTPFQDQLGTAQQVALSVRLNETR